jgi:UDP-N-acetylmuramoylalanine--D-glutamate ligase
MTTFASKQPDLAGARVLVVGAARSGLAAAALAAGHGASVVVNDRRPEADLGPALERAGGCGATVVAGGHPADLAARADLLIVSPGVPPDVPPVVEARRRGVPVWSEIELAWRFTAGRVVAITGTNGKSTTTAMAGAILRGAGIPGGTGGNLGTPFSELLVHDGADAVHAVEVSSFQLEAIEAFRASAATILNLTPDHLDRYPSIEAYASAKARLLETQTPGDAAILNADDPEHARFLPALRGVPHFFSTVHEPEAGAFVRAGRLVLRTAAGEDDLLAVTDLPVPGEHNVQNALAAALLCRLAGCAPGAIADALRSYRALPHRLEHVADVAGVRFFNDSKATNLDAAERALRSFPDGTIHVILGGKDKGADWASIGPLLASKARRALLVGAAAPAIRRALSGSVPLEDCGTVAAAVEAGLAGALPGDVVLLAPGCASFDQYRNFEERGEDFRRVVLRLAAAGRRDA